MWKTTIAGHSAPGLSPKTSDIRYFSQNIRSKVATHRKRAEESWPQGKCRKRCTTDPRRLLRHTQSAQ